MGCRRLSPRCRHALLADEPLESGRCEQEEDGRSVLPGFEAVGDVARTDHEIARLRLDRLVPDLKCQVSLRDEERLLLTVVNVRGSRTSGRQGQLDHREPTVRLVAAETDLGKVAPPPTGLA